MNYGKTARSESRFAYGAFGMTPLDQPTQYRSATIGVHRINEKLGVVSTRLISDVQYEDGPNSGESRKFSY